ncbi:MAG TPA: GAF domain-containing protein, partial [Pirellulales bacterium]|nr:GAF domain-containing protein [Pirellulales bacterium]
MSVVPDTPRHQRFFVGVAFLLVAATAAVDWFAPANVVVPILYGAPVAAMAWLGSRKLLWSLTCVAIAMGFLDMVWGAAPTHDGVVAVVVLNRFVAAGGILVIAALADLQIRHSTAQRHDRQSLQLQNTELESLNEELRQREELIVRQNEELQSQTEELESQSEELRLTNAELVNWEHMLEQLLELSRALTIDLKREEILGRICEAMEIFSGGLASAIIEKRGDEIEILCHQGFGSPGLVAKRLPYSRSFSSLVISAGQTAFLEDTESRPDLQLPRRAEGPPFRAVLAAPLRVHGRCIGTVEMYSPQPRGWNEAEVSMLESLAAQASISSQSAELVATIEYERRRFEAAVSTVPIGMLVAEDVACNEVRANPAAAALLNVSKDENLSPSGTVGQRLMRYLFRGDHALQADEHPLLRAVRGIDVIDDEMELMLPNGRRHALLVSASPIYDFDGRVTGAVCAMVDVTAQKTLQRELEMRRREAEEAGVRK